MTKLQFDSRFVNDMSAVYSAKVAREIDSVLDTIELFGAAGSRDVSAHLKRRFGDDIRKFPAGPFDVIYAYDEEGDIAHIRALIHQKRAL